MARERTRGFTLVELLVVIAIISLLVTIVTTVGASALSGGRGRQTQDTIRAVDAAIATYLSDVGNVPPAFVATFAPAVAFNGAEPPQPTRESFAAFPLIDGVDLSNGEENRTRINSMGLFMRALENVGLGETLASVPTESLTRWDGDSDLADPETGTLPPIAETGSQPEMPTILDAWGRPLRFVHPSWDGPVTLEDNQGNARLTGGPGTGVRPITPDINDLGFDYWLNATRAPRGYDPGLPADFPIQTVRRNFLNDRDRAGWSGAGRPIGDSDGGYVIGNVPYVYSAGGDGDPSTIDDNSYTTEPRRPVISDFD